MGSAGASPYRRIRLHATWMLEALARTRRIRRHSPHARSTRARAHGLVDHSDRARRRARHPARRVRGGVQRADDRAPLVAMFRVHLPFGFSSIKLIGVTAAGAQFGPPGYEVDLLYIACLVAIAVGGPGPFAVDNR